MNIQIQAPLSVVSEAQLLRTGADVPFELTLLISRMGKNIEEKVDRAQTEETPSKKLADLTERFVTATEHELTQVGCGH